MTYKVGDAVFIHGNNQLMRQTTVERVTATQVVADGRRYLIKTGREMGYGDWRIPQIMLATPELIEKQNQIRVEMSAKIRLKQFAEHLLSLRGSDAVRVHESLRDDIEQIMAIGVAK